MEEFKLTNEEWLVKIQGKLRNLDGIPSTYIDKKGIVDQYYYNLKKSTGSQILDLIAQLDFPNNEALHKSLIPQFAHDLYIFSPGKSSIENQFFVRFRPLLYPQSN